MVLSFYGAALSVTGTKHLLTTGEGTRILLDCGMSQGKNSDKLNADFLFNPSGIDFLILSHAHIDHSGLIPALVKKGFRGRIICTQATKELTEILLLDSAKIQQSEAKNNPKKGGQGLLYTEEDVLTALNLFEELDYKSPLKLTSDITVTFYDAGHILGSAAVHISFMEHGQLRSLCFTGDLGRYSNRILREPESPPEAEIVICESTYGDSLHQSIETTEALLEKIVRQICLERKGKLLIPSFSIGRTQELVFSLNNLSEEGRLADIPVYVDSPLSVYATEIVKKHPESFNESMKEFILSDPDPFGFPRLKYITEHEESMRLITMDTPSVIISSSGMMDAGRIVNHLKANIHKPETGILITGYSAPGTLGYDIGKGKKEVVIEGEKFPVQAELYFMKEYSAHGDYGDLLMFLSRMDKEKIKTIFLVHGEKRTMLKLKRKLVREGFRKVELAQFRLSYEL